jgi:Leucine-rich repeat (LRR) protein
MRELEELCSLNLSNNMFSELPECLGALPLVTLYVQCNKLVSSDSLGSVLVSMKSLQVLDLSSNNLSQLPSTFFQDLSQLLKLNVSNNRLKKLPPFGTEKLMLCELNVSKNDLVELFCTKSDGDSVFFPQLTTLQAHHNCLERLASGRCSIRAPTLSELGLSNNRFTCLNIHSTVEQEASGCFLEAPQLEIVLLRDNNLVSVPEFVLRAVELKRLDIANNNISSLPPQLSLLSRIDVVLYDGNPMKGIPRSISTTVELLRLLRNRITGEFLLFPLLLI